MMLNRAMVLALILASLTLFSGLVLGLDDHAVSVIRLESVSGSGGVSGSFDIYFDSGTSGVSSGTVFLMNRSGEAVQSLALESGCLRSGASVRTCRFTFAPVDAGSYYVKVALLVAAGDSNPASNVQTSPFFEVKPVSALAVSEVPFGVVVLAGFFGAFFWLAGFKRFRSSS